MKDRIPGNPGRVLITPENGASYYATIVRADNPLQEGDALNKLNLLPDNVAELLGLDPKLNPVPATAFEKIGEKIKNVLGLNFTVYGGTSVPETAGEGDIWVNTDTPITSWAYSPKEPENPTEGKIWLKGGGAISFVIDTGTNGNIKIFPGSAAQYIGGTWVDKSAKSYQNGEWKDWILHLLPSKYSYSFYKTVASSGSVEGDTIVFANTSLGTDFTFVFDDAFNVANYSTLKAALKLNGMGTYNYCGMAITSAKPTKQYVYNDLPAAILKTPFPNANGTYELEIDLSNISQNVYICFAGAAVNCEISNIRLE